MFISLKIELLLIYTNENCKQIRMKVDIINYIIFIMDEYT